MGRRHQPETNRQRRRGARPAGEFHHQDFIFAPEGALPQRPPTQLRQGLVIESPDRLFADRPGGEGFDDAATGGVENHAAFFLDEARHQRQVFDGADDPGGLLGPRVRNRDNGRQTA